MSHVLVIDDSEFDRRMILRALKCADKSILCSELDNGDKVIEALHEATPDLILLDIRMPGTDGFDVLDSIKNHEDFKSCNVVMISGSEARCDKRLAKEKGAEAYFTKPNTGAGYAALAEEISQAYLSEAA